MLNNHNDEKSPSLRMKMTSKTTKLELSLEQSFLDRLDDWTIRHGGGALRKEAALRLMNLGLQQFEKSEIEISDGEKLIITMLCDLYPGRSTQDRQIDPDFVLSALILGHYWGLSWEYNEILHNFGVREQAVNEVADILDMWLMLESSYGQLSDERKGKVIEELDLFGTTVLFSGFDGNNESDQYSVVGFLVNKMNRYQSFKGRALNSHSKRLAGYQRMLKIYQPKLASLKGGDLEVADIIAILKAEKP